MLYRTLHNPFSHSPHLLSPLSPRLHHHPPPPPPLLAQGMECVQEVLKTDFVPETASFTDDFWSLSGGGGSGDDLFVDELLDFSNGCSELEDQQPPAQPLPEMAEEKKETCRVSPEKEPALLDGGGFSDKDNFGSLHGSELSIEAEGLESLEWLSHFVEDSFPDYSLAGKLVPQSTEEVSEPAVPAQEQPCFATPVQTKARTKRARTGVRVWPVLSPSPLESSASASSSISSASSTTTSFSPPNLWLIPPQPSEPKPAKKPKRKPADGGSAGVAAAQPRKCSHCGVTKTPQWRAGPMGSKTLCNACGVRFKSGRLLPEYRPACSPTFSSELHSNNHRKVLEMRRKKETEPGDAAGPSPPVQSF